MTSTLALIFLKRASLHIQDTTAKMPELARTRDKKSFWGSIDIPYSDLVREKRFVNTLLSTANKTEHTEISAAFLNLCAEGSALGNAA